jgi:hypothetical protein
MMNRLALIPFVFALVTTAGMFLPQDSGTIYHRVVLIGAALATAISAFMTMARFAREDRLYACWLLIGAGYSLAGVRYVLRVVTLVTGTTFPQPMLDVMLILQNVAIAVALLLFVRAWRATGLAAPGSRSTQWLSIAAGIAVAVLVGGYPLIRGIATAKADLVLLVSTLGDMVGLALIVPLMMSALAMRGGLLMHTWVYLAASEVAWLCYDIWYAFRPGLPLTLPTGRGIEEAIRIVAVLFAFAATLAQRRAIRA